MNFRLRIIKDKPQIDFMRVHKITLALALLMVLTTSVLLCTKGLNMGIDFTGGILIEIKKPDTVKIEDIRKALSGMSEGTPIIQEFGSDSAMIKIPGKDADTAAQKRIYTEIQSRLGSSVEFRRTEYVGPQVGSELVMTSVYAFLWSLAAILVYIWFRFEWQFGLMAVLALVHDSCATMLFFVLTGFEFDLSTVAAVLLIAGYSLNETVVVFDRIREMLRKYRKMPLTELLNMALNDTLSRTITTSLTTVITMASLAFFGTEAIKGFCYAMLVGIFFGPISSNFVSSPLLLYMNLRRTPVVQKSESELVKQ
ncbi:MAG: protein translocase subunit SecF [Alphaproteobacteria bacterium]|nr:protein translocase subunit SecF [Alphaproteobacteria bacterium]